MLFGDGVDHHTPDSPEFDECNTSRQLNDDRNGRGHRPNGSHRRHGHNPHALITQQAAQSTTTNARQTSASTSSIAEEITEAYLSKSLQPSHRISQPTRKLLVLDLNGTLVYRLPLSQRSRIRPRYHPYSNTSPAPSRLTYPRPYLPSFRRYLFHPETRGWLDVMVWSSAQPHSVRDMLKLCFPRDEGEVTQKTEEVTETRRVGDVDNRFFAVWARDTLGLSKADYSRKVQTTKNLEKVWTETSYVSRSPEPLPFTTLGTTPESDNLSTDVLRSHSSLTTLLLDDSPLKARLQPWNHLCIPEYGEASWKKDTQTIKSWDRSQRLERNVSLSVATENNGDTDLTKIDQVSSAERLTNVLEPSDEQSLHERSTTILSSHTQQETHVSGLQNSNQSSNVSHNSHKSLRFIDQQHSSIPPDSLSSSVTTLPLTNSQEITTLAAPASTFSVPETDSDTFPPLDETLLAIIGVLEELKQQSNVCGWLRNRGLWIKDDEEITATTSTTTTNTESLTQKAGSVADNTSSKTALLATPKNTPESSQPSFSYCDVMSLPSEQLQNMPIPGLSSLRSPSQPISGTTLKRPRGEFLTDDELEKGELKRFKSSDGRVISVSASSPSSASITKVQHTNSSSPAHVSSTTPSYLADPPPHAETDLPFPSSAAPIFWFEDENVIAYWVKEGRRALRQLGIAELHGVEVSNNSLTNTT